LKTSLTGITMTICLLLICCAPREANAEAPVPVGEQNEMLRPPLQDGKPVVVSIALHVINLTDIDEVSERYNLFRNLARPKITQAYRMIRLSPGADVYLPISVNSFGA
jgi:hypothetical protein